MRNARKEYGHYTVGLLRDLALFGEREEDLLRGWLGHGTFEVGRDVDGAVRAVYLFRHVGYISLRSPVYCMRAK